jgi:uncharacterized protein (TIGR02001 family)
MKTLTKALLGAVALTSSFAGVANAQDESPFALSAAVAVQSDYRFRGISQNDREFAPQATINLTGPEGFYAGAWGSKTNWALNGANNPSYEVDFYFGKNTDLFGFANWNTQIYYYAYPDARTVGAFSATKNASFVEWINTLSKDWGGVTTNVTWAYTPEFSLGGGTGNYVNGQVVLPINDWLSISGLVGHQWVQAAKYSGSSDYTHYDIGATATWKSLALDLRFVNTDLSTAQCGAFWMATAKACGSTVVATLTYNISAFPW